MVRIAGRLAIRWLGSEEGMATPTIAELAVDVGLSRSSLVERFTRYLWAPPMAYLTDWRLRLAARR